MIDYTKLQKSLKHLELQYENYCNAQYRKELTELDKEGISESAIQRFETCYDSLWKTLKRYLIEELGIPDVPNSPKPILRLAFENQLFSSPIEQWLQYANARIDTACDYDKDTRLEHWRDYASLLESPFFNRIDTQLIFRGHRRYDWSMTPTLGRLTSSGIVTEKLAKEQLAMFRKAIRGRIKDHSLLDDENEKEDDELWSIGQHHGLMTPLLDWTYSPYVALFFAFSKEDQEDEKDNPYRAVYILNKSFVSDHNKCPDIRVFEPKKDDHGRLVSQAGLFTFSPFDATIENKLAEVLGGEEFPDEELKNAAEGEEAAILGKYICKIYIKNEQQQECLKHLRRMNVHHASLFPDLIGAADYCNIFMTEIERDRNSQRQMTHEKVILQDDETIEASAPVIGHSSVQSVTDLLTQRHESQGVEPGRIALIAEELSKVLAKGKLVDWQERESLQAEIKAKTRILLRKLGYPESARNFIIDNILNVETDETDETEGKQG